MARPVALAEFLQGELTAGQAAREALPVTRDGNAGELDPLFRALLRAAFAE